MNAKVSHDAAFDGGVIDGAPGDRPAASRGSGPNRRWSITRASAQTATTLARRASSPAVIVGTPAMIDSEIANTRAASIRRRRRAIEPAGGEGGGEKQRPEQRRHADEMSDDAAGHARRPRPSRASRAGADSAPSSSENESTMAVMPPDERHLPLRLDRGKNDRIADGDDEQRRPAHGEEVRSEAPKQRHAAELNSLPRVRERVRDAGLDPARADKAMVSQLGPSRHHLPARGERAKELLNEQSRGIAGGGSARLTRSRGSRS